MHKLYRNILRAKKAFKEKGLIYVISTALEEIVQGAIAPFSYQFYKKYKSDRVFEFQGKKYNYTYHMHNYTWKNERSVELSIIMNYVRESKKKNILEVGNTLSHYVSISHEVLDKYEIAKNVINEDVISFKPSKKYDLIVSISTLEHVGWDEKPRDADKILKAVKNLRTLLAPRGKLVVTLPIGYHPKLVKFIKSGRLKFDKKYCLKRISRDNQWVETDWDDISNIQYGYPFSNANGILIGIISA